MPNFRYSTTGTWYKGNTHIHSIASDGGKTFPQLARMYKEQGYDFLFRTDHWVATDVKADTEDYPLLWLDGTEINGHDHGGSMYHVVCLGTFTDLDREQGFVAGLEAARRQGGLLILAHPLWSGNSLEDALRWGFHGVELYNCACHWDNGKGGGLAYWNAMLERFPNTLGFAVDDAHIKPRNPGWNGGWIMVNAAELSRPAILAAIRAGDFYSSCGPELYAIENHGHSVTAKSSPVQFARVVGPAYRGIRTGSFEGRLMTEVTLEIPQDWPYAYLEVEDTQGHRAWTNPLFVADE